MRALLFLLYFLSCLLYCDAQTTGFVIPADRQFIPVSQVPFSISLPDGNTTDAQLLEFECTERLFQGYVTVNDTTYYIECVKPMMRVPLTELGRVPAKVQLHSNIATLAPDGAQYKISSEFAANATTAKPTGQISSNPAGRSLLQTMEEAAVQQYCTGSTNYVMMQMCQKAQDSLWYSQHVNEFRLVSSAVERWLPFSSLGLRVDAHDNDIAMLSTILTGSTCLTPNCLGGGGLVGQLARNNLTLASLGNRTSNLEATAFYLQAQLVAQQNATDQLYNSFKSLAQKADNTTRDLAVQINQNIDLLKNETTAQIVAITKALNSTQKLIDLLKTGSDNDFEYIYTQILELQDSSISAYSDVASLGTHKVLRDLMTLVFFEDLRGLDSSLIPLLKDSGIAPQTILTGADLRITIESIDLCFLAASSTPGRMRVVCQYFNIHSNAYHAVEYSKYSVNYKHLYQTLGPIGCVRPYTDGSSPVDFDTNMSTVNGTMCKFYIEVTEKSCEIAPPPNYSLDITNPTLGSQEQTTDINALCQGYNYNGVYTVATPVTVTKSQVIRSQSELLDFIKTKTCKASLTSPKFYMRFYQTGTTIIVPQDTSICDLPLGSMERVAYRTKAVPLAVAFGTGWKIGWIQSQKFVSTLSLKLRGRIPGGVSNTDINYMPWTPTRLQPDGSPILDGGADAVERWTMYWLAVSPDTIPVYSAQSIGINSVKTSARVAIVSSDTCNPNDPTCYKKETRLSVNNIVLDANTYNQLPDLPYLFMGDLQTASSTGMYDAPSTLISSGFDPSIQINKVTCLLMPPGTNRTLDIQYFWDVKGTLYDPKNCGINPDQFKYDALISADGFPYCNINGGAPVENDGRSFPLACLPGYNYTADGVISMYQPPSGECADSTLCNLNQGCLYNQNFVYKTMIKNATADIYTLDTINTNKIFTGTKVAVEFWLSITNNSRPANTLYKVYELSDSTGLQYTYLKYDTGSYSLVLSMNGNNETFLVNNMESTRLRFVMDIPVHFVIHYFNNAIYVYMNGFLASTFQSSKLPTFLSNWATLKVGGSSTTLTTTFLYGLRLRKQENVLIDTLFLYQCGPYSSKGSGCSYSSSTPGASSVLAELDLRSKCSIPFFNSQRLLYYTGSPVQGSMPSQININSGTFPGSFNIAYGGIYYFMSFSWIDSRKLGEINYASNEMLLNVALIDSDGFPFKLSVQAISFQSKIQFKVEKRNSTFTSFITLSGGLVAATGLYTNTFFTYEILYAVAAKKFGDSVISINGVKIATDGVTRTDLRNDGGAYVQPPGPNFVHPAISRLYYHYPSASVTANGDIFGFMKCLVMKSLNFPSNYDVDINSAYSTDLSTRSTIGQCIMSPSMPGFGYCRTPELCGGHCQAWSMVNTTSRLFVPITKICDAGYTPPDCVRPCSRTDLYDGYCIDQYSLIYAKNGYAPTSKHCSTARTAGMTVVDTQAGKYLVATPYQWRQTFKVVVPSGRINLKTVESVCPTVSNAFRLADGRLSVVMTSKNELGTQVVVSWYPLNPATQATVPQECLNLVGDSVNIKGNSIGTFTIPTNGCGELTIVISLVVNGLQTKDCTQLTTSDVTLIVNSRDITAEISPVVTRMQTTQENIVSGIQQAIEDVTSSLIRAFTNIVSLVDTSNQISNYSSILLDNILNIPKTTYNANVTVRTNFTDAGLDARYQEISDQINKYRNEVERLQNSSVEAKIEYANDLNNLNVTNFLINLVGSAITKGFNLSRATFAGSQLGAPVSSSSLSGMEGYSDKCKSSKTFGIFSESGARRKPLFSIPGTDISVSTPSLPNIPNIGTIPGFAGIPALAGSLLPNGLNSLLDPFSDMLCGLSFAADTAERAAKFGVDTAGSAVNTVEATANAAYDEAKKVSSEGFNIFNTGAKSIGEFFQNMMSIFYYLIPVIVVGVVGYLIWALYSKNSASSRFVVYRGDEEDYNYPPKPAPRKGRPVRRSEPNYISSDNISKNYENETLVKPPPSSDFPEMN